MNVSITADFSYHSNVNLELVLIKGVKPMITRHPSFSRVDSVKKKKTNDTQVSFHAFI